MLADYLIFSLALGTLIGATISDIKTREIPDMLNFGFISSIFAVRLMYSILYKEPAYFLYGLLFFGIFFGVGLIMYRLKQWGGGDVKLFGGLGLVFATKPDFLDTNVPLFVLFIFSCVIGGAAYGIAYSIKLGIKHRKGFLKEAKKLLKKNRLQRISLLVVCAILVAFSIFIEVASIKSVLLLIVSLLLTLLYVHPLIKAVENVSMYKYLDVKNLSEGDWVAEEVIVKGKVICSPKDLGLTKEQIKKLQDAKIKKVLVKEGMPFVPGFLIAFILTFLLAYII